ncbi:hypothetical protein PTKU15_83350 [Paraburkholderia terrae]|nr:hypothetical protein PTKU15_83350 [Paraburkholderia terrae]
MVSDLRSVIRVAQGRQAQPSAVIPDGRTLRSTCESGPRAGYDGFRRKRGRKVHMAVDKLGQLLAVDVTPGNEQERAGGGTGASGTAGNGGNRESGICRSRLYG